MISALKTCFSVLYDMPCLKFDFCVHWMRDLYVLYTIVQFHAWFLKGVRNCFISHVFLFSSFFLFGRDSKADHKHRCEICHPYNQVSRNTSTNFERFNLSNRGVHPPSPVPMRPAALGRPRILREVFTRTFDSPLPRIS